MEKGMIDAGGLQVLSRLFCYPETLPDGADLARVGIVYQPEREGAGLTNLQNEYVRLFINALPEAPCPPYGSYYLEGTLMGESAARLQKLYGDYGVMAVETPDHIAVELEFLALLAALYASPEGEKDYRFLLDHLNQWTPEFFGRIEKHDRTGFYRDLSRFAGKILLA